MKDPARPPKARVRVAVVTNAIPIYRRPIFEALQRLPRFEFRIFLSLPPHLSDAGALRHLPVHYSRGLNIPFKTRHAHLRVAQTEWLHLPILLPWDLLRFRPDIVICGELGPKSLLAYLLARVRRVPLVLWSEATLAHSRGISRLQRWLRTFLIARATAFLAWGEPAAHYLGSFGIDENKIYRCVQAVDNDFWMRERALCDREATRTQLNFRGKVFLAVGRLVPLKGFDYLLRAWAGVAIEVRDRHMLVLVGAGPEESTLRRLADALGLRHIVFAGAQSPRDLVNYYTAADVVVVPSLVDVWGLVVNEAMACGLPVLGSKYAGASQQLIRDDSVGELFDPLDLADFTAKLQRWCMRVDRVPSPSSVTAVSALRFEVSIDALRRVIADHVPMSMGDVSFDA
jgi:glycosyltransferase involved in cell wall biosynthesis